MMIGGERELDQRGSIFVQEQELHMPLMINVLLIVIICLSLFSVICFFLYPYFVA